MKKTLAARVLDFTSNGESIFAWHQAEVAVLPELEIDDRAFNRSLALERKRSERSKRPFMLMLISVDSIVPGMNGIDPRRKIFSCLRCCKRDTDVMGWYRSGSVVGIIFTDICTSDNGTVCEFIGKRIRSKLASVFDPDDIEKIGISFDIFPEKAGFEDLSTNFSLCREQTRRDARQPQRGLDELPSVCGL